MVKVGLCGCGERGRGRLEGPREIKRERKRDREMKRGGDGEE